MEVVGVETGLSMRIAIVDAPARHLCHVVCRLSEFPFELLFSPQALRVACCFTSQALRDHTSPFLFSVRFLLELIAILRQLSLIVPSLLVQIATGVVVSKNVAETLALLRIVIL